jgi:hypothetical protein
MKRFSYNDVKKYIESFGCKLLSDEYINNRYLLHIQCQCGNMNWYTRFDNFKHGQRCQKCRIINISRKNIERHIKQIGNLKITHPNLCNEWNYNKNKGIVPENFSFGSSKKVWWICSVCGYEWCAAIGERTKDRMRCKKCKRSIGEERIMYFLDKFGISYFYQHKFDDCRNKNKLSFDFYLPNHAICIEYDGEFHYKKRIQVTDKEFENEKLRDEIKNIYCKNNNIKLIRIPYWNKKEIESILKLELIMGGETSEYYSLTK